MRSVTAPPDQDPPGRPAAGTPGTSSGPAPHPIALHVDADLARPRLVVAFRPLLVAPHLCWLALWSLPAACVLVAAWAAALATGRVPAPLHRFLVSFVRATAHVSAFVQLVGRTYPGFLGGERDSRVVVTFAPPTRQRRLGVLARLGLSLPAILLAAAYALLAIVAAAFAWCAALVTGRMPAGLRDLGGAALRYETQTAGYLMLLTSRYPDASPRPDAPATRGGP